MTDQPGWNLHGMFRTSDKIYDSRPPANCKAARWAWDYHLKNGPVVWMRLLDGYWGAKRQPSEDDPDGAIDEVENA